MASFDSVNGTLDLIWGAKEISRVINRTPRVVFNMLERGEISGARKVGGRWVIERSALARVFTGEAA